jgi:membrane associated rhomboid family serine protease
MAAYPSSYSMLSPVVRLLLVANGLMFVLELSYGEQLVSALALWPLDQSTSLQLEPVQVHFQLFQLVTYSFLHGSVMHLLLNMYALWLFGTRMENVWGSSTFAVYYFVCVLGAGLTQLLVSALSGGFYPTIGASGGVFGLLLAFGMRFPNEVLMLIFPPVAMRAKWFVAIYAGIELWAGVTGTQAGVAHFAHLGGMLFGYLLIQYWRRNPPRFR